MFAWEPSDMVDVPREQIKHDLNEKESAKPITQKKKGQSKDMNKVINEEVDKLVNVGIVHDHFS